MKHLGDITKIKGDQIPIVDCICGGSPCQYISLAGRRDGLAGERSGLFMEQIRIVKEMRKHDIETNKHRGISVRPRYLVWENVTGALSSGSPRGEDFRIVLEEICKVADESAHVPRLAEGQRWSKAGCIMGDGWSVAWRVHNSKFWGSAQRRERVSVVGDFGGHSAPEVLFERKGMHRTAEESEENREASSEDIGRRIDFPSYTLKVRGGCPVDRYGHSAGKGALIQTELSGTLGVSQDQTLFVKEQPCAIGHDVRSSPMTTDGFTDPLTATDYKQPTTICYKKDGTDPEYVARRLTPKECERLQCFPDDWTNIGEWTDSNGKLRQSTDAMRYKALGNSICLPFWFWLLRRISAQYVGTATLGSLFDGIGGFPLCWERCNGKGSALWASEIEEFPIAVTKYHFPDEE